MTATGSDARGRREVPVENLPRLIKNMLLSNSGIPVTKMQIATRLTDALDAYVTARDVKDVLDALQDEGAVSFVSVKQKEGSRRTRRAYYVGSLKPDHRGRATA